MDRHCNERRNDIYRIRGEEESCIGYGSSYRRKSNASVYDLFGDSVSVESGAASPLQRVRQSARDSSASLSCDAAESSPSEEGGEQHQRRDGVASNEE